MCSVSLYIYCMAVACIFDLYASSEISESTSSVHTARRFASERQCCVWQSNLQRFGDLIMGCGASTSVMPETVETVARAAADSGVAARLTGAAEITTSSAGSTARR